ncbi:hypothetical protein NDU88_005124 [Pleurodeles waltl]|uniref:Uncharacterized protein n=1 Tax=Pleurodeles waltl TaxID=8319 RepID=A0AAV7VLR1_PLEWA|nr:hypothetical protein NDU88_005124 [Pleurodeles waltl]
MRHPERAVIGVTERKKRGSRTRGEVSGWKVSQRGWKRREQRGPRHRGRLQTRLQTSTEESRGRREEQKKRESQPHPFRDVAKPGVL